MEKKTCVSVYVTESDKEKIESFAEKKGVSLSTYLRMLLRQVIENEGGLYEKNKP